MSFKIEQGLFNLDFTDHHAILGVSVDAEMKDIRKRYLTIARRLHPDSCATENPDDRQRASEFLSKLVNPAYEQLSQERNYNEHLILLKLKGQQASRQQDTVMLTSDQSRKLAASGNLDQDYRAMLKELGEKQYQALQQTLERIGQISELNLVYLMRKQGSVTPPAPTSASASSPAPSSGRASSPPPKEPPPRESPGVSNLRRAEEYIKKQNYTDALKELRESVKINPKNGRCHSLLGVVYMATNQATMAKIHFKQALALNPQDSTAQEAMRRLDPNSTKEPSPKDTRKPPAKDDKSTQPGSGIFGGFFGGKKK